MTPARVGLLSAMSSAVVSFFTRRDGAEWWGPGTPLPPVAPRDVGARQFDYPTFTNINYTPRKGESYGFQDLRALADGYDLVRLAIEKRKDQLCRMKWSIGKRQEQGKPAPKSSPAEQALIDQIEDFFNRPDGQRSWSRWLRALLEDLLVIDAPTLAVKRDRKGRLLALKGVDGATINLVLDGEGRTPDFPMPAYQQIIKGQVASNYSIPAPHDKKPGDYDELVYLPRNVRTSKIYGFSPVEQVVVMINIALRREMSQLAYFCYSDDTEVLTRRGWIRFADALPDDEFAARAINSGAFEWQKATTTFYKHYTGPMVHFTGQSLDMLVTPHHRMLVNSLPRALGDARAFTGSEHVITAEQMMLYATLNTGIPLTSRWKGEEIGSRIFADADPSVDRRPGPRQKTVTMSGDDYCAFMGMYLAEGSLHHKGSISIAQPRGDARGAHDAFKALLDRVFETGVCFSGHCLEVCRTTLASYLRQFGKAGDKFIPDDIRNATPRQIEIFLRYYLLGDGNAVGDVEGHCSQAFTVSRKLADQLTEVGQKSGYASTTWTRPALSRMQHFKGEPAPRMVNGREGYVVTLRKCAATRGWKAELVHYDAPVACVSVPSQFLYVRRNGKAAWSGNTAGNIPDAFSALPDDWTPDQVQQFQAYWDATIEGDLQQRRKLKFIPGNKSNAVTFTRDPTLKDDFDEFVARVICFAFGISPTALVRPQSRAMGQAHQEEAQDDGLSPHMHWVKELVDYLIETFWGDVDLEFQWVEEQDTDPLKKAQVDDMKIRNGSMSIDEVRANDGQDPIGVGNMLIMGTGVIKLEDVVSGEVPSIGTAAAAQISQPPQMPGDPSAGGPVGPAGPNGGVGGPGDRSAGAAPSGAAPSASLSSDDAQHVKDAIGQVYDQHVKAGSFAKGAQANVTKWDESSHPRGQPSNAGQFAASGTSAASVTHAIGRGRQGTPAPMPTGDKKPTADDQAAQQHADDSAGLLHHAIAFAAQAASQYLPQEGESKLHYTARILGEIGLTAASAYGGGLLIRGAGALIGGAGRAIANRAAGVVASTSAKGAVKDAVGQEVASAGIGAVAGSAGSSAGRAAEDNGWRQVQTAAGGTIHVHPDVNPAISAGAGPQPGVVTGPVRHLEAPLETAPSRPSIIGAERSAPAAGRVGDTRGLTGEQVNHLQSSKELSDQYNRVYQDNPRLSPGDAYTQVTGARSAPATTRGEAPHFFTDSGEKIYGAKPSRVGKSMAIGKEWTAGTSATSGMTAYDLDRKIRHRRYATEDDLDDALFAHGIGRDGDIVDYGFDKADGPKVGHLVELKDDRFSDKGPATGRVTHSDGKTVMAEFGGDEQTFHWPQLHRLGTVEAGQNQRGTPVWRVSGGR